ncbi:MAG: efflux RND transporter periplasmic adaptor subunit [Bacteroidales bacterium]|nr:efflux RND transporter periplasmic adaptor subunit [Bacteroidales bacterium]
MKRHGIVMLLLIVVACNHPSANLHDGEEEITFQTTLFSDSTEYFIEYPALIKDHEAEFLVHTTKLKNYKPYTTGSVSIKFGEQIAKVESPARPGIFIIKFVPEKKGKFAVTYTFDNGKIKETVSDSIRVFDDMEEAHQFEQEEIPGTIKFTKEQVWKNNFMVEKLSKSAFSSIITASGEMLAMPGEKQNIAAKSIGILLFASKGLVQGSKVKKGELLFTLSGQDLSNNNIGVRFSEAKNNYLQSKSEFERHQQLFEEKIISEKQFIESQSQFRNDSSAYFAFSASVSALGQRIYAPLTGYIHELNVSEGQYVETGQLLATISTNKIILLRADLPQQNYQQLNLITSANFRPAYTSKTYKLEDLKGSIIARGASVAENNHYMPVYFKVLNDGSLLEGAFAEFYLITSSTTDLISVPNSALIEEQGNYYVYTEIAGESYIKTAVETGETDGIRTSVLSGLKPGDLVVTKGTLQIKITSSSGSLPAHSHEH